MSNLIYVPEVNYRFSKYWSTFGEMPLKSYMQTTETIEEGFKNDNSFLRVLFDDTYSEYDELPNTDFINTSIENIPVNILRRLRSSHMGEIECSLVVENGVPGSFELYPFKDVDGNLKPIFQKLFEYRKTGNIEITDDDYDSQTMNNLEVLVFMYLNLCVNGVYDILDFDSQTCDDSDYELYKLYEIYLMNEAYRRIKLWEFFTDFGIINLRNVRINYKIPENWDWIVIISTDLPHDTTQIKVYHNGEILDDDIYNAIQHTNYCEITFDSEKINLKEDDVLILDYYTNDSEQS